MIVFIVFVPVFYIMIGLLVGCIAANLNNDIAQLSKFSMFTVILSWPLVLWFSVKILFTSRHNYYAAIKNDFKNLWNSLSNTGENK